MSRDPQDVLLEDQVWSNPDLVRSNLASIYDSKPDYQELEQYWNFTDFDEAFPSRNGDYWRVRRQTYDYGAWEYWDYGYIHNINLFLARAEANSDQMEPDQLNQFVAEARFLRANAYFEMVKRMGGVPLITDTLSYEQGEDPTRLFRPRAEEAEVYDFIISEMDAIASDLPTDPSIKSTATWGAAMAMKSRAALYAGSIARYGANTPSVFLPNGEVGIPEGRAEGYYQSALDAATELIESGRYSLYKRNPNDLSANFTDLFRDKQDNPEVIWAKDYLLQSETHQFTVNSQPKSLTEEGAVAGFVNPSLNLVQDFELMDNTFAPMPNRDSNGDLIAYEDKSEIFANRDPRLAGTVILPGSQFKGQDLDIWAGVMESNGTITTGDQFGQQKTLPGESEPEQVVGFDGPIDQLELGTQTGFYIRKYLDPGTGRRTYRYR
ncbi:MAG: RagB/SusD family nutrient uptake outer membrane protein [Balneolaceae bacterium]|nr:RagB/SusD family nutrient uptake outer membrane protein [Balneolaceae bacterium]